MNRKMVRYLYILLTVVFLFLSLLSIVARVPVQATAASESWLPARTIHNPHPVTSEAEHLVENPLALATEPEGYPLAGYPSRAGPFGEDVVGPSCDCELEAEKTADAEFTRTYSWEIIKAVEPASHTGWFGDEFTSSYDVSVNQTIIDSDHRVIGVITVTNPTSFEVPFTVSDSVDGVTAVVDCDPNVAGNQAGGTLAPGGSATCSYEASLSGPVDGTNAAEITSENAKVRGATATAEYVFAEPTTVVGEPTINVTDYFDSDEIGEALGSASGDFTFEYGRDFMCPTDETMYADGVYTDSFPNIAKIDETEQSDSANVDLTCYKPVLSKDVDPEWFQEYTWSITKSVDPDSHAGFLGDIFTSSYDVFVNQTITSYGFRAFGRIYVTNPSGESITVDVADAVDGTRATVDCDGSGETSLTVAASATGSCAYSVDLPDNSDRTNTATVTFNGYDFQATADVIFGDPIVVGHDRINVTDYFDGDTTGDGLGSASGDHTFEYDRDFACPTDEGLYTDGEYVASFPNTATIDETGQSDDANVDITCLSLESGQIVVEKVTEPSGAEQSFTFSPSWGPSFELADGESESSGPLSSGTYSVTEALPDGWVLREAVCSSSNPEDQESPDEIRLQAGETVVCTFTNLPESETPVTLLYFRARGAASTIRVEWASAAEINLAGYYIYRAESERFATADRLTFLVARGSSSAYEYLDRDVEPGKAYWYWLVSVDNDGSEDRRGPAQATMVAWAPDGGFRIYLPLLGRGP